MFPSTHYQHSGKAPIGGVLLTLIGGVIAGVLLGAIYGFLIFWSPFVYINAFITFGFGVALATVVGSLGKLGKLRNVAMLSVVALLVAILAYFVHWVVWVERMTGTLLLQPDQMWAFLSTVNVLGPWSIFGWTPTGAALWGIWGIEALVIAGIGTVSAQGVIDIPYCEETKQWTTESILPERFGPLDAVPKVDSPSSLLQALRPDPNAAQAYTEVAVATAEGSELRCVSISSVSVETNKDGKEEAEKTNVVKNMLFDRDSFERLMQLASAAAA